jgi:hypothetical protein
LAAGACLTAGAATRKAPVIETAVVVTIAPVTIAAATTRIRLLPLCFIAFSFVRRAHGAS